MKWQISGTNVPLSPALIQNAERKLRDPLNQMDGAISSIQVLLRDLRPGVAPSECELRAFVRLRGCAPVFIRQKAWDFYAGLDLLAWRVRHAVTKRLGKLKNQRTCV